MKLPHKHSKGDSKNNADLLLTAYDGQPGGTVMTCELVRRFGMPVILSAEAAGDWLNVQCTVC